MFGWKALNNIRAIMLAVVVHIIALGILMVNIRWLEVKPVPLVGGAPIQAKVVDRELVEKKLLQIEKAEKRKQREIENEKRRVAELARKREAEIKRKKAAELKRKKAAELKRRKAAELKRKQAAELKRKQAAELKRKQAAELKRKQAAELKRKQAAELKRKQAAELKRRKAAELEKKKAKQLAEENRRQKEMEASLLRAMEDEENESKIAYFISRIGADVQNNWLIPPTARKGMQCRMLIRLLPSGEVRSVQIIESSGDKVFDRSAEDAVYRASPLPVSASLAGKLFQSTFREFNFLFTPRNL